MQRGAYQGPGKAWNFARIKPRPGEEHADAWATMTPLQKEAWRWSQINREAKAFFDMLPPHRRLELPARDLFASDLKALSDVFAFSKVPAPAEAEIRRIMGQKMNAQAHFNGLPFEWTEAARAEVRPFIADTAALLGYET